jgi:phage tail-like protein
MTTKLSDPIMSLYPFLSARFCVELKGLYEGFFTECNGLQMTTEVFEYKEGGVNNYTHKLPVRTSFSNVTLKHGMTPGVELWEWYQKTVQLKAEPRDMSIVLYSHQEPGKPLRRWNFSRAYPIKWTGPDFKVSDSSHAIETIEIVHSGFKLG